MYLHRLGVLADLEIFPFHCRRNIQGMEQLHRDHPLNVAKLALQKMLVVFGSWLEMGKHGHFRDPRKQIRHVLALEVARACELGSPGYRTVNVAVTGLGMVFDFLVRLWVCDTDDLQIKHLVPVSLFQN